MTLEEARTYPYDIQHRMLAEALGQVDRWHVRKHGYYYRPKAQGYTSHQPAAGVWTETEAEAYCRGCGGEVTKIPAGLPQYDDLNVLNEVEKALDHESLGVYIYNLACLVESGPNTITAVAKDRVTALVATLVPSPAPSPRNLYYANQNGLL